MHWAGSVQTPILWRRSRGGWKENNPVARQWKLLEQTQCHNPCLTFARGKLSACRMNREHMGIATILDHGRVSKCTVTKDTSRNSAKSQNGTGCLETGRRRPVPSFHKTTDKGRSRFTRTDTARQMAARQPLMAGPLRRTLKRHHNHNSHTMP